MTLLNMILLAVPVAFLFLSVVLAVKSFEKGKNAKRSVITQLVSFAAVFAFCLICPTVASAATEAIAADTSAIADDTLIKNNSLTSVCPTNCLCIVEITLLESTINSLVNCYITLVIFKLATDKCRAVDVKLR